MIVSTNACAKINWLLRVLRRRPDEFHDIETIFQTITLQDSLTIRRAEQFSFTTDDAFLPRDEQNLVVRAVGAMTAAFNIPPVAVELTKRIPSGAGLGGGSSDAAATLRGLAELFEIGDDLQPIALQLGSDVPFFLVGGTAYATGRGEKLRELPAASEVPLLLACPAEPVSTADAYRWLDDIRHEAPEIGFERISAIAAHLRESASALINDFEPVVFKRLPFLAELKRSMLQAGAWWSGMTGSGSTIAGAFDSRAARDRAAAELAGVTRVIAAETRNCP